jgi:hypothetical protein
MNKRNYIRQRIKKGDPAKKFYLVDEDFVRKTIWNLEEWATQLENEAKYVRKRKEEIQGMLSSKSKQ